MAMVLETTASMAWILAVAAAAATAAAVGRAFCEPLPWKYCMAACNAFGGVHAFPTLRNWPPVWKEWCVSFSRINKRVLDNWICPKHIHKIVVGHFRFVNIHASPSDGNSPRSNRFMEATASSAAWDVSYSMNPYPLCLPGTVVCCSLQLLILPNASNTLWRDVAIIKKTTDTLWVGFKRIPNPESLGAYLLMSSSVRSGWTDAM